MTESAALVQTSRMGRPPLAVPFVNLNTKVPREVRAMLEAYATKHGVPLVDVLCRAIEAYTSRERKVVVPWPRIVVREGEDMRKVTARRIREALDKGVFAGNEATEAAFAGHRALSAGRDLEKKHHATMLAATLKVAENLKAPGLKYGDIYPKIEALRPPSERLVAATEKALRDYGAAMDWTDEVGENR